MQPLILVIEDDPDMRDYLAECLHDGGYRTLTAPDGASALRALAERRPALMVLDVMLAGPLTGWEVCQQARAISTVPILMLTSLADQADQTLGLNLGADDYIVKPVTPRHLLARVHALLRRTGQGADVIQAGPLTLDMGQRALRVYDQPVALTRLEFDLLAVLARKPNRVFTRGELLQLVWDPTFDGVDRVVDVHLSSLRRKLGPAGRMIRAVRGVGYQLAL